MHPRKESVLDWKRLAVNPDDAKMTLPDVMLYAKRYY
jgi:hypothetical protein